MELYTLQNILSTLMAEFYSLNGITTHISVMAVLPENGYHDGLLYSSHCAHVQNQCSFYVQSGWEQGPFVPLVSNTLTAVISSREPFPSWHVGLCCRILWKVPYVQQHRTSGQGRSHGNRRNVSHPTCR